MNETPEEAQRSLADEAATWVPPWERAGEKPDTDEPATGEGVGDRPLGAPPVVDGPGTAIADAVVVDGPGGEIAGPGSPGAHPPAEGVVLDESLAALAGAEEPHVDGQPGPEPVYESTVHAAGSDDEIGRAHV